MMNHIHDAKALELSREVMALVYGPMPIGGSVQLQAKIQCLFVDAMEFAGTRVSDGWIPVSERMPEEGGRYWCYVEEQNSLGKSHYQWNCSWNGEVWSDKALSGRVTHWMPLPAAPQQEVK